MRFRMEILGLLLIVTLIAVLMTLASRDDVGFGNLSPSIATRSSYLTLPEGYQALYTTLRESGYATRRLTRPYALLPERGLLIVADPYKVAITPYESRRLFAWVAQGNHALLLLDRHSDSLLAQLEGSKEQPDADNAVAQGGLDIIGHWLGVPGSASAPSSAAPSEATAVTPSFLSKAAPTLAVTAAYRFPKSSILPKALAAKVGGAVPLYADAQGIVTAYSALGAGGIVWCASPDSFSNASLATGKNLDFILALANLQPAAPVIFDEYHHGYGANMNVWSLTKGLTRLGLGQLALALLLMLATLGWRFGAPRLPAAERFSRSRAEYLTSMASLLERAQATHVVCERLSLFTRRELGRRLGVPVQAPPDRFLEANGRLQVVDPEQLTHVIRHLTALEQQHRPDPESVFRLAGEIQRLLHRRGR